MSSIHFDFVDLRLFVYIAEENSLTRGAQRIHISLPAASMRIKKLEESIGIPLFERTATGINLLPAEIGRASCRERVEIAAGGRPVRRKVGTVTTSDTSRCRTCSA